MTRVVGEWFRRVLVALCTVASGCAAKGIDGSTHFLCNSDAECGFDEACIERQCVPRAATPSGFPTPPAPGPLEWSACPEADLVGADCATMTVPLDYAHPERDTITIALSRVVASDPAQRIGSLLLNRGGPGKPGRPMALEVRRGFERNGLPLSRFDLIGFDPRGVGASTPVDCGDISAFESADYTPDDATERVALEQTMRDFAGACRDRTGPLIDFLDSQSTARDMEQIRRAFREDQISYFAVGYDTLIGAAYAGLFPERVRAMVLDSPVVPGLDGVTFWREQAEGLERGFESFATACNARPDCAARFGGDVGAAFDQAAQKLDRSPLLEPDSGRTLTENAFVFWVTDQVGGLPGQSGLMEAAIDTVLASQPGLLPALVDSAEQIRAPMAAIQCTYLAIPDSPSAFDQVLPGVLAAAPHVGQAYARDFLPCVHWAAPAPTPASPRGAGAPPILVVGGTGDPNAPYSWSERLATELDSAVLLTREGIGHGYAPWNGNQCLYEAINAYLVDLRPPTAGTVCAGP